MTTGVELITEIGELSCDIADLNRYITSHPMSMNAVSAYRMRDLKNKKREREREKLRKQLASLPDLTFS